MQAKDVFDGMKVVLTEFLLNQDGFRKGDVVRVETDDSLNPQSWEEIQRDHGRDAEFVVYVLNDAGEKRPCFTRRFHPAVNSQMELF